MIIPAVIILLVILLIANTVLAVSNSISPPCYDMDNYFSSAKKTSDDELRGLASVNVEYKSGKIPDTSMDYTSCGVNGDEEQGENYDPEKSKITIEAALKDMFPTMQKGLFSDDEQKSVSDFNGARAAVFDTTMEGVLASPMYLNLMRSAKASDMAIHSERDGYH